MIGPGKRRPARVRRRAWLAAIALVAASFGYQAGRASLITANQYGGALFLGRGGYSADALGQEGTGGTVQADVPLGSTVERAFLYGTYNNTASPIDPSKRAIDFDGSVVVLEELTHAAPGTVRLRSARGDVTDQVAAKIGLGGGVTSFAVNTNPSGLDGVALLVIFSNPILPVTTIAVMDGGAEHARDEVSFFFLAPITTQAPGFAATMSLGIGYSYQADVPGHVCSQAAPFYAPQYTKVDVNGATLTSCAGHYDDGQAFYRLITVGGVGDDLANPPDPNGPGGEDDELYNIAPFLSDSSRGIDVVTTDRSTYQDDILFLMVIAVTAVADVGCAEDGLDPLDRTPLKGVASGVVHRTIEPTAEGLAPGAGLTVHRINCIVVDAAESRVDS